MLQNAVMYVWGVGLNLGSVSLGPEKSCKRCGALTCPQAPMQLIVEPTGTQEMGLLADCRVDDSESIM